MIFRPIAEGITFLEGDQQLFGSYLPTLFGIRTALNEIRTTAALTFCEPLIIAVQKGFLARFTDMMDPENTHSVPLFLAMASNPKYKLSFIPPSLFRTNIMGCIKNMMMAAAEKLLKIEADEEMLETPAVETHENGNIF